ncbi:unnamed protein product [Gongylonema pulchrum]|uniref:ditrans,polycis-polyprenyl diphosphate synthase [(2E,6E)-farnesyldiphosphate specific] n=1 Tax=Gongylonema pulchrum TaxID=637853 RepID=A0A183EPR8_9BILA|nr:unnamed protein product [Gongylonema pulchrum]
MRRAFVTIARGVQKGLITESDINERLISQCLDSRFSRDPDLLIRTSGETRLSDFLLWQCSKCCIYFDKALWPEFGFWNLCKAIYTYQRNYARLKVESFDLELYENCAELENSSENGERVSEFLRWAEEERQANLQQMAALVFE